MGLLERIFKHDSLGGNTTDDKSRRVSLRMFGINLRDGDDMYCIKIGARFPFIGKLTDYEWGSGSFTKYGVEAITGFIVERSWGFICIRATIFGFGLYFSFQDGNY